MFVKLNKSIILSLLALFLLIIIPISFAADNSTAALSEQNANETQLLSVHLDEDVLEASNDYYFDASVESDGDGSLSNPYKYLTADRIRANSNLYLANGQYQLDASKSIQEVRIIGSDVDRTIIEYDGVAFTVNNQLTLSNVTLRNLSITNYAKFNATNVVFEDGYGSRPDAYGNNYGGAIFTDVKYATAKSYVSVDNCTFKNNYAVYGGAIYMGIGNLKVSNCLFLDNIAYNYGGAIACEYMGNVSVSKSRFHNSRSLHDAGGSIYIRASSRFAADNVDIVNSSSTFGGALTTLNTSTSLNRVSMINNSAKYDGGAVFHMYGDFLAFYSNFNNNSARNGGAIFIDNSTDAKFRSDTFTNNRATGTGGAIYSLLSKLSSQIKRFNTFTSNVAANENDCYDVSKLSLTIGNGNYTMYGIDVDPIDILPVRYSLIEEGYTTPVKDQESSGNCWAFTALSVLESCILKATGERLDLSEENMKNIMALYSDYGWNIDTNEGGYDFMHWGYLAGWLGPVDEMSDLFDDKSALSPILNSIMHIQNIKFLKRDSYTDNDEIKRAILNYGAVGTGMYFDSYYFSSGTDSYYCWYTTSGNHAVTIVGWDDAYSRSNFKYGSSIEGDGAWIVRNSWGPEWGDDGYFYVSYYDANFARPNTENIAYTIVLNDTIRFDRNYQYDIAGITDYFINSSSKVWYKNKFTAASDEYLAAVSTYFEKASNWTATVFVNGEMKDVLSGISTAGYYTFNLNRFIPLKAGDAFEVIFNITTSGEAGIPISEIFHLNKLVYLPEMSYMSYDGENWVDLYDLTWEYSYHPYYSAVASIKAFTFLNPINTFVDLVADFTQDGPSNVTASVRDEYANPVKYGNVTFNVNGENRTVGVVDGKAILLYNFNKRVNSISASFEGVGYSSSFNETTFTLPKLKIAWTLNVTQFINNVNITVSTDEPLNESVVMNVHGENIPFELVNGINTLTLTDLPNDIYAVNVLLSEDSDYLADVLSDEFVIDLHHARIVSGNLTADGGSMIAYNVTLLDEADNPIADREIAFNVANATYANMTGRDGVAVIFMQLDRGVHDIIVLFKGDNSYFPSNASGIINVVVSKMNATIKVSDSLQVSVGGTAEVGASSNSNGPLSYVIGDESVAGVSDDGVLTGLKAGATSLTVSVAETDEYNANSVTVQVNVNKRDTSISVAYNDGAKELVATLTNDDGKALNSANVIVALDGANHALKTNSKGQVKLSTADLASGSYTASVSYKGNSKYNPSNATATFIVNSRRDTDISLVYKSASNELIVTLTNDEGKGLVTANVVVCLNGVDYSLKTNSKGQAKLSTADLASGHYNVTASYKGNSRYNPSSATVEIFVKKTAVLSAPDVCVVYQDESGEFVATLINAEGKALNSANVVVTLDGMEYALKTNSKGQVRVSTANLTPGTYAAVVSYNGNSKYNPASATAEIVVDKKATDLSAVYNAESNELVATLINGDGKALNSANVIVTLDGVDYALKTNSKGQVRLSTANLTAGTYTAEVSYRGNSKYAPASESVRIVVE